MTPMNNDLLTFSKISIQYDQIVWLKPISHYKCKIQYLCELPYPDHPNGCPNYNKNPLCPPHSPNRKEILKKYQYFTLFMVKFDFKRHKEQMKMNHPDWSDRQIACNLYYQSHIKKLFYAYVSPYYVYPNQVLMGCGSGFGTNIYSMESVGINVFQTLKKLNYQLEPNPQTNITFVSLLASDRPIGMLPQFRQNTFTHLIKKGGNQ